MLINNGFLSVLVHAFGKSINPSRDEDGILNGI